METYERSLRRRFERVKCDMHLTMLVRLQGWDAEQYATALDLSTGGARILTMPAINEGQAVYLFSKSAGLSSRYARVVWVQAQRSDGACEAGLEFLPRQRAAA